MTRGTKLISVVWVFILLLGILLTIFSFDTVDISLGDATNIATIVGVVGALFAVLITFSEYIRRRKMDAEEVRPYVTVGLVPSSVAYFLMNVEIKNIGKSAAKDVSISFTPNQLLQGTNQKINDLKIMKSLKFLPPNEQLLFYFGDYRDENISIKHEYKIQVQYTDISGRSYNELFVCDPRDYEGTTKITVKTIHDVAKALEEKSKR